MVITCVSLQRKMLSLFTPAEKVVETEQRQSVPLYRSCANMSNPWKSISQQKSAKILKNLGASMDEEGNCDPLQYSCLENPMGREAWWAAVHGVVKSRTRLSNFTFTFMHWRRKWQPTPVSCLENPRDGKAWWAAIYGIAQSQTWLKRLSNSSSNMDWLLA